MLKGLLVRTLAALGIGAGGVAGYAAWSLSGPFRAWPPYTFTPYEINVPADEVRFTAADGVEIAGWWFDDPDAETTIVCCHGHRGGKADLLGLGPKLHQAGHNVLLFDFRGSGDSGDGPRSLAHHEQHDLRAALDWAAARRPGTRIVLVGMSMGASVALQVAADDPRVEALVVDSPFATVGGVLANNIARYRIPAAPILPLADAITRARYGYRFDDVRPLDAIARIERPILLMHGTEDRITPFDHSRLFREAARSGVVEFVAFEGVDHCGGYFVDRPGYVARVDDFIRRALA